MSALPRNWASSPSGHRRPGFPAAQAVTSPPANAGDTGSIPASGRSPWTRKWQPAPVFLPGDSHGQRSLAGCSPGGHRESDTTDRLTLSLKCLTIYINRLPDTISLKNEVSRWHIASRETRPRPVQALCPVRTVTKPLFCDGYRRNTQPCSGAHDPGTGGEVGAEGAHTDPAPRGPGHCTAQPGRRSGGTRTEAPFWGGCPSSGGSLPRRPGGAGRSEQGRRAPAGRMQRASGARRDTENTQKPPEEVAG